MITKLEDFYRAVATSQLAVERAKEDAEIAIAELQQIRIDIEKIILDAKTKLDSIWTKDEDEK